MLHAWRPRTGAQARRSGAAHASVHQRFVDTGLPGVVMSSPEGEWERTDAFRPDYVLSWSAIRTSEVSGSRASAGRMV